MSHTNTHTHTHIYIYIHSKIPIKALGAKSPRRARGSARPWPLADALSRSKLPRSHRLKNFRRPQRRFERTFSLELGRPGSILVRSGAPGLDFGGRNRLICEVFRRLHAVGAHIARGLRNIAWAHKFQASSFRTTRQKQRKIVPRSCSTALGALSALRDRSKVVRERPKTGPRRLLTGSHALLARPGRPKIDPGAFFWRPGPVPSASRRVPKTASSAQNLPRSILHRFFVDCGSIFVDFRKIFRCISLERLATKAQNRNLKKESRDPHRASWLLRGAIFSYCSHVFRRTFGHYMFSFFSLRTHKPT